MGLFDIDNTDIFGAFFDLDGDGKVSWDEEFIAHKIIADCIKGEEDDDFKYDLDYDMPDETVPATDKHRNFLSPVPLFAFLTGHRYKSHRF